MSDNKDIRDRRDRSRIDLNDRRVVSYVRQQYPWFSAEEVKAAIRDKGPDRKSVIRYLDQKSGTRRQLEDLD